jgi:hypothetical protein
VILAVIAFLLCKRRRAKNIDMKNLLDSGMNLYADAYDMDGTPIDI